MSNEVAWWRVRPSASDSVNQYGAFKTDFIAIAYAKQIEAHGHEVVVLSPDSLIVYPIAQAHTSNPVSQFVPYKETTESIVPVPVDVQEVFPVESLKTIKEIMREILHLFGYLVRRVFHVKLKE